MKKGPKGPRKHEEITTVRTTGRIKKAKVVFDPSDNYLPKNQRNSAGSVQNNQNSDNPSDSSNERRPKEEKVDLYTADTPDGTSCYICNRRELKKNKNKLISCKDCEHKAHIACLRLDFEDHMKLRENYRCDSCQICASCYEGPEDGELITCTKCVKSFHFACHIPSMARFPTQSKWFCSKCTIPKTKSLLKVLDTQVPALIVDKKPEAPNDAGCIDKKTENNFEKKLPSASPILQPTSNSSLLPSTNLSMLPSPNTDSPQPSPNPSLARNNCNDLCEIPVVKNWSANQVTEYFKKFFPEEAAVFKDQDIDGQSLLLIKRSDVVNRLAIKLGPALRIYNLILKIQSLSSDPTIGW